MGAQDVGPEPIEAVLARQHAELGALLAGLDDDAWATPTGLPGWDVRDVVLHLAQTDEMAVASFEGRIDPFLDEMLEGLPPTANVDDGAGAMVEHQRGASGPDVRARWQAGSTALAAAVAAGDPAARLTWVAGELSARSLTTTRFTESWIHTFDIVDALGGVPAADDRLWHIARLAWRTIPYAFARAGEDPPGDVTFALTAPDGSRWQFGEDTAPTVLRGDALDLCLTAGQRANAAKGTLTAEGPNADDVLRLVRTFA